MKPKRSVFSLRKSLIKVHQDLFQIEAFIISMHDVEPLTTFEKIVLVLEDRRFLRHDGVDWIAFFREFAKFATRRNHGGASTIDMQFVRTATGYKEITIRRKLYEMFLSFLIQFRYSKLQILRSYLSCAFFGSGMIGAEKAASIHFQKRLRQLTDTESAELASMLVYPRSRIPKDAWRRRIERRSEYGLRRMRRFEKLFEKIPGGE